MTTVTTIAAGTWTADLTRTRAAFTARHLFGQAVQGMIAVTGGTVDVGPDGQLQQFCATLDPASVDTGNTRRDADLRGRRFLAVDAYSLMEAAAGSIEATADGWRTDAVLRVRGCEAPLRIDARLKPSRPRRACWSAARRGWTCTTPASGCPGSWSAGSSICGSRLSSPGICEGGLR